VQPQEYPAPAATGFVHVPVEFVMLLQGFSAQELASANENAGSSATAVVARIETSSHLTVNGHAADIFERHNI
jgi:hypothetical protein